MSEVIRARKVSPLEWFRLNLSIGALSFGGSGRMLLYFDAVVRDRQWVSEDEFHRVLTLAQTLPGPNLVNISVFLGLELSGWRGAVLGVLGLGLPGALIVMLILAVLPLENTHVRWVFQGFSLGSVSLFVVFIAKLVAHLARLGRGAPSRESLLRVGRFAVVLATIVASLCSVPLAWILIFGIAAGVALEVSA